MWTEGQKRLLVVEMNRRGWPITASDLDGTAFGPIARSLPGGFDAAISLVQVIAWCERYHPSWKVV